MSGLLDASSECPMWGGRPAAVDMVDPSQQVALADGELSRRHQVRNNVPDSPRFCPMVRWTETLKEEDGNGRVHRWLIHHVLTEAGYNPPELPFPISAAILRNISAYRNVLQSYSKPLLPFIEWEPTGRGNVRVLNDTADHYRFFDATALTAFLFEGKPLEPIGAQAVGVRRRGGGEGAHRCHCPASGRLGRPIRTAQCGRHRAEAEPTL